jgi:hypothetical protein
MKSPSRQDLSSDEFIFKMPSSEERKNSASSQLDHKRRGRGIPPNGETLPWRRLWSQINSELSALGHEKAFLPLF